MRRFSSSVGAALGLACLFVLGTGSAQPKKAKPKAATAAPAPARHGKPTAHGAHDTKPAAAEEAKPVEAAPVHAPSAAHEVVEHESHIEFDERMVRGQSAAGAIYLFNRSPSEFKSIVKVPESFRARTVQLVVPRGNP